MDRNRETRRAGGMPATANGVSRRRHRISSLRDSPEDDGTVELQAQSRLRVRGLKKDRDRDIDLDRDRDRDTERERDLKRERSSSTKRRAAEKLMQGSIRDDDDGDDSSEHSTNDDGEDYDDGAIDMLPPKINQYHDNNHNIQKHRKCFTPASTPDKVPRTVPVWKSGDEMIGVSVPRKARSASTKRSHDWISGGGGGVSGEQQIHQQASASPVRTTLLSTSMPLTAAPLLLSSSNASARKKMKPNGSKVRPPKSSSKSSSSHPEELEIEIAEVLYGLKTQPQGPVKEEIISTEFDSREVNKSQNDTKSSVSSPTSNSQSITPKPSSIFARISSSSTAPISSVVPKRKKPKQVSDTMVVSHGAQSAPLSSIAITAKTEPDQILNVDIPPSHVEKNFEGSNGENGGAPRVLGNLLNSHSLSPAQESMKLESTSVKFRTEVAAVESGDVATSPKDSAVMTLDDNREDATMTVTATVVPGIQVVAEIDNKKGEKIEIDMMVPSPLSKSSPERQEEIEKPMVSDIDNEIRPLIKGKEGNKMRKIDKDEGANLEHVGTTKEVVDEAEQHKLIGNRGKNIDLQLDFEQSDMHTYSSHKSKQQIPKQEQQIQKSPREEAQAEKPCLSSNLPSPMTMASWPGGIPHVGYMAPLGGVVSTDGSTLSPASMQPLFSQPRPKRCATHCYIARNIHYLQQFMNMNPFWPTAAGPTSLFGAKPYNITAVPSSDLQGNVATMGMSPMQDKAQNLTIFPGHNVKDKGSHFANFSDSLQRKPQILLHQALPPIAPNNLLQGPAFIFPLNQQQAALDATSLRPGSTMSSGTTGNSVSSSASTSASVTGTATAAGAATALSFSYPTIPANESQYLAILQNNGYPFPVPAVGAPPNYSGTHGQNMSFFNGSIYSSQMIHQSQPPQIHRSHQNASISNSSSSSHRHMQSQQQKPHVSGLGSGGGNGNFHNFPAPKSRLLQPVHSRQKQHFPSAKQSSQQKSEVGGEDSPSTADSRVSRARACAFGQNIVRPAHAQNIALITPDVLTGIDTNNGSESNNEGKQQQALQRSSRAGVESLPPQTFAMSFPPFNSSTGAPNIDISTMAQNPAILQSLPETARQFMAAAAQKEKIRIYQEGKSGSRDSSDPGEERKGSTGMTAANLGQSVSFSRPDLTESNGSAIPGNSVIDSSAQPMNLKSVPVHMSNSSNPDPITTINSPSSQLQAQLQHQPQQITQLHKQQYEQYALAAAGQSKTPASFNGNACSEHFSSSSSSVPTKFLSSLPGVPQSDNISPTESSQWRNSLKTITSQVPSSLASSAITSLKSIPHQQLRGQQIQMQISFGGNQKVAMPHGQQSPGNNQSISGSTLVGCPSVSKVANGSPKIVSSSTSNKTSQASVVTSQKAKNLQSVSSLRSSPVTGKNISSILGNPQIIASSSTGTKFQQQQQLPKNTQQAHIFFSPYMQDQQSHSTSNSSTGSATDGYYLQRRQCEQQQPPQQLLGTSAPFSTGLVSLCPVTLASSGCMDPTKAIATASNMKGGFLPRGILRPVQFTASHPGLLPTGFSYLPTVPAAVHVKPAEQKQPTGE